MISIDNMQVKSRHDCTSELSVSMQCHESLATLCKSILGLQWCGHRVFGHMSILHALLCKA